MKEPNAGESDQLAADITAAVGAAALGVGTAILTNPAGGVVISASAAPMIRAALDRVLGLRGRQVAVMVEIAVRTAERTYDELLERATTDRHRAQLFSAAVRAAANTALESKLEVLGRLLAQGLLGGGDDQVEEARLVTAAIEDTERLHLRVLERLTRSHSETLSAEQRATADSAVAAGYVNPNAPDAWPFNRLVEELGISRFALEVVIGTLSGRSLIVGTADRAGTAPTPEMQWTLTDPGRAVLQRFRDAGEAAARSPASGSDDLR